jgi:hypothetical protein
MFPRSVIRNGDEFEFSIHPLGGFESCGRSSIEW